MTDCLNLQAMIFLLHGMNINFQAGGNQIELPRSKIPGKNPTYFRLEPPFELEHGRCV